MAQITTSLDPNRAKLSEVIPLDSPFAMYIEPTRTCNFKCFYCMHSTRGDRDGILEKAGFRLGHIDMGLYQKVVQEIVAFPTEIKRITFSGLGEPLMNPRLPEMIQMLRTAGFQGRIDVITNGSLLTHEFSNALIIAGMNRLQVSIQGLDRQQYLDNCGVAVDLDALKAELAYFHERSAGTAATLYIKIIDSMLRNEKDKEYFFQMFDDICDTMWVEHLVVLEKQMGDHGGRVDKSKNLPGDCKKKRVVCPVMFYYLQVTIDGLVLPCPIPGLPNSLQLGDVNVNSLQEIWNGNQRNELLRRNLQYGYASNPSCGKECSGSYCITDSSEDLDDCREELLERIIKQAPKNGEIME